ncbi:hypothetical protein H1P_2380004 [Hyella patelloides LEGE 07179]|uniref:Uncharacterized protein n=1 Tax=Hyella patelloides LEGE 07179 TaxID=945734 RepID=A0A563VRN5_9CYAN|nr:hypothetical protein [Hyella patelloides]VEP14081.1 hypothetical protein H1P_2380004 [Hyella patelloides LEGE 07179]
MQESSLSNSNKISTKKNLIQNLSTNSSQNLVRDEIDTNNNQEFQNLVNQMILNLIAKTEAELITISTITQKYKETVAQKTN